MGANYTRNRLPVKLVYFEDYYRIEEAFIREKHIQKWGHNKKKALIEANWDGLHQLAICRNQSHYKNRYK